MVVVALGRLFLELMLLSIWRRSLYTQKLNSWPRRRRWWSHFRLFPGQQQTRRRRRLLLGNLLFRILLRFISREKNGQIFFFSFTKEDELWPAPRVFSPGRASGGRDGIGNQWSDSRSWTWNGRVNNTNQVQGRHCVRCEHENGHSTKRCRCLRYWFHAILVVNTRRVFWDETCHKTCVVIIMDDLATFCSFV